MLVRCGLWLGWLCARQAGNDVIDRSAARELTFGGCWFIVIAHTDAGINVCRSCHVWSVSKVMRWQSRTEELRRVRVCVRRDARDRKIRRRCGEARAGQKARWWKAHASYRPHSRLQCTFRSPANDGCLAVKMHTHTYRCTYEI